MDLLEYLVRVRGGAAAAAEIRGLAKEMDGVGRSGSKMGGSLAMAGKGVAVIGAALIGVGVEAVKASTSFNHEMLRIRTDAGASTRELANMKKGVLDLASSGASMGQGPMSLAQGLYHLESLGIRGSKALKALALASQESAISGANLEETTTAMGAAMFVGIKGTGILTHLMGILNATVGAGNMRFQQLVEALGTGVLPSAKVAGLGIQDVSAALAVATDSGYQASSAAAQLGTAFHFLYAPTKKATDALASIGLQHDSLANDMHKPRGLLVALRDLKAHLQGLSPVGQSQVLNAILPGGRGRILLTELTMLDRLKGKYDQINKTAGGFGGSVAQQRKDPQTKLRTAEAGASANLIRLGDVLTPVVVPALTAVVSAGSAVLKWLTGIPGAIKDAIHWFDGLTKQGTGTGNALHTIGSVAMSLWATVKSAFGGIASTAHGVFSGSMVKDLGSIGKALLNFGAFIFKILGPPLRIMIAGLAGGVRGAFNIIGGAIKLVAGLLTGDWSKAWQGVKQLFGGVITIVGSLITWLAKIAWLGLKPVADFLTGAFTLAVNGVIGLLNGLIGAINTIIDGINTVTSLNPFGSGTNIGHIATIGTIGGAGSPAPAKTAGKPKQTTTGGHRFASHFAKAPGAAVMVPAAPAAASGWNGGDIVIKIGSHEFARIQRREIVKSMAAGA